MRIMMELSGYHVLIDRDYPDGPEPFDHQKAVDWLAQDDGFMVYFTSASDISTSIDDINDDFGDETIASIHHDGELWVEFHKMHLDSDNRIVDYWWQAQGAITIKIIEKAVNDAYQYAQVNL
jgi:hypothetical protein